MKPTNVDRRCRAHGFTLIELLVAIAILGILATITINEVWGNIAEARVKTTETKLRQIKTIVEQYKIRNFEVPRDLNELLEPDPRHFDKPWVESEENLLDAWENPMEIRELEQGRFEIISYGADRTEGGEGLDTDLSSNRSSSQAKTDR